MNVKLLRKVAKHILAEPKRLYMSDYVKVKKEGDDIGRSYAKCGTAACVGGCACILSRKEVDYQEAKELLGLDMEQAVTLFAPSKWPYRFQGGVSDDGKANTAKIAAARIEYFIKSNGAA